MEYFIGPTSGSPSSLHSPNLNIILCLSKTWLVLDILPTEHSKHKSMVTKPQVRVGNMERLPTFNFTFTARWLLVEVKWKVNRPHQANMELLDVKNRRIWKPSMAWFIEDWYRTRTHSICLCTAGMESMWECDIVICHGGVRCPQ